MDIDPGRRRAELQCGDGRLREVVKTLRQRPVLQGERRQGGGEEGVAGRGVARPPGLAPGLAHSGAAACGPAPTGRATAIFISRRTPLSNRVALKIIA